MKPLEARVAGLCYELLEGDPRGRELLEGLKNWYLSQPTFPMPEDFINQHGGPLAWAAFREGNLAMLRHMEHLATSYKDSLSKKEDSDG